jgi:hypothetical protein
MPENKKKSRSKAKKAPMKEKAPEPATVLYPEPSVKSYEVNDREKEEVGETDAAENIYNDEQREEMLADDEISSEENAFMEGAEMAMNEGQHKKKKQALKAENEDTPSVELAKGDAKRGHEWGETDSF